MKDILIVGSGSSGMSVAVRKVIDKAEQEGIEIVSTDEIDDNKHLSMSSHIARELEKVEKLDELKEPTVPSSFHRSPQHGKLMNHIDGKRSILDEYKLIKSKKSELSKNMRDFVIGIIEEEE